MTFLELYSTELSRELASSDTTILFTTTRRKKAINDAMKAFIRLTACTRRYGSLTIVDGTAEYDLETLPADFNGLAGPPSLKIVGTSSTRYIQGPDLPRRDPEWLDRESPNWRAASAGTPRCWYLRDDGSVTYLGFNPAPDVGVGETWTVVLPYIAEPTACTSDSVAPFIIATFPVTRLEPYHMALVHYAAALLEPLRKNYAAVTRQMQLFAGYVAQYLQDQRVDGPDDITIQRNYLQEAVRGERMYDIRRYP
jgi:hypothetical protein